MMNITRECAELDEDYMYVVKNQIREMWDALHCDLGAISRYYRIMEYLDTPFANEWVPEWDDEARDALREHNLYEEAFMYML